ncbi:hypothetical protein ACP_1236 [Acidobacterium capsulatum ATCC 51196]|uniref:Uncharacterized protein n=1 Tax=Acidobacterium capsulatum (strain ATCC 51196 / DSM 11244 / BCRC 80197 / JCM 7670 / NBRC 15755 / NCIMB 13165 / 161) TaxID=240015 RepID=C1F4W2_ACIC5|nr:hypothetical protein ACP_1236 [Acidobacterium capsulatum ATCC 51196]
MNMNSHFSRFSLILNARWSLEQSGRAFARL